MMGWVVAAQAEVRLPAIFSEHAVLQRSGATAVWGWAEPGEKVVVTFGAATAKTAAGKDGRWRVSLDLSAAGTEATDLVVEGTNRVAAGDVVVGEVWLASGQSNMQLPLNATENGVAEAARSANAGLRWFAAETRDRFLKPQEDVAGRWFVAGPETSGNCSAVAYYFGREIGRELKQPVGLILTAVGGTTIQAWLSEQALAGDEVLRPASKAKKPKKMPPLATPSYYFNQLIHPFAALSLRGVLWYQGEAHFSQGAFYSRAFPALIRDWRRHFGKADLPFYFCQLPNVDKKTTDANDGGWVAEVREAQDAGLKEPNTGEAVLIDVGGEDLHPPNKEVVGSRLAALAKAGTYGMKVAAESPRFQSAKRDGGRMVVTFGHCRGGLVARALPGVPEGEVRGFAICGADGNWVWADAEILGETVAVSSPEVPEPVAVRYAWSNNPTCNLFNHAGLPVAPFRTQIGAGQ